LNNIGLEEPDSSWRFAFVTFLFALLQLKHSGQGDWSMHKAKTQDCITTYETKVGKRLGANDAESWVSVMRLKFLLPEDGRELQCMMGFYVTHTTK
jgi:hypothetical protein